MRVSAMSSGGQMTRVACHYRTVPMEIRKSLLLNADTLHAPYVVESIVSLGCVLNKVFRPATIAYRREVVNPQTAIQLARSLVQLINNSGFDVTLNAKSQAAANRLDGMHRKLLGKPDAKQAQKDVRVIKRDLHEQSRIAQKSAAGAKGGEKERCLHLMSLHTQAQHVQHLKLSKHAI